MITSTDATTAATAAVTPATVTAEGELRSRGTSRNNPQSGEDDDNDEATSCQKRGWFGFRASRFGILQKYKARIFGAVLLSILIVTVVVLSIEEDVSIVSVHRNNMCLHASKEC